MLQSKRGRSSRSKQSPRSNVSYTSESDVGGGAVRRVRRSRRHSIPVAVRFVAKIRSALHHAGAPRGGPRWILSRPHQVIRRMKPIRAPFPCISAYREQSVPVRRKRHHRRCSGVSVFGEIAHGKIALPDVAQMTSAGRQIIAPRKSFLVEAATRGEFPFRLRG